MSKTLTDDDFANEIKNAVLYTVYMGRRGENINFARYNLSSDQDYVLERFQAELARRKLGYEQKKDDSVRELINTIIAQEEATRYSKYVQESL